MSNNRTTDEIAPIDITIPPPNLETPDIRFIDVHIYDQEPEPEPARAGDPTTRE